MLIENPAFLKIQATLLKALAPHPEARAAVVLALRHLDAENAVAVTAGPAIGLPAIKADLELAL